MDRSQLYLGAVRALGSSQSVPFRLPAHHLVTHGVVVGTTGSGKTGLLTVLIEEALRAEVPVLVIDVKGDLPNLLLSFPSFAPSELLPWANAAASATDPRPREAIAAALATERQRGLSGWSIGEADLEAFSRSTLLRVVTPGASAGELLHVLSSLERRSDRWNHDPESARAALSAAISLVLRLLGRDPDPAKSREHVLLSVLAERRLAAGASADLPVLLEDLANPPLTRIGALELEAFFPRRARRELAAALNTLLASPTFASWRVGTTLDIGAWMTPQNGRTPAVVVSVAHLDDDERALVLGVLREEVLTWVRSLPGSQRLRALVVFDEVYGFLPPHPANPPTKRPLVALMKRARSAWASWWRRKTRWTSTTGHSAMLGCGGSDGCRRTPTVSACSMGSRWAATERKARKISGARCNDWPRDGSSCVTRMRRTASCSCSRGGRCRSCAAR
ncbi:MAG TPA: helicase HerA-like domain-containing protein [Polyangiaceae bacterium]|nr:helicase HerA-like domain-containing protein [Polyangiaceae bacterium]